jgi:hypothetical protein
MARDKIQDLRHHLFAQLERLGDDKEMEDPKALEAEIQKAKAISGISHQIIESAKVEVQYLEALANVGGQIGKPSFLGLDEKKS